MSKRRITGMNRRTGDKHGGERAGDININERAGDGNGDKKTDDDYYFDKEDDYSEEASLYKPAPPVAQEEKPKKIKVEKLRRDDKGRVLSGEPVPMPKENLYYNSDGYIPQENVNYSRRADAADKVPEDNEDEAYTGGTGADTDQTRTDSETAEAGAQAMEKAEAEIQAEAQKELSAEVEKIVSREISGESADDYALVSEDDTLEDSAKDTESEDLYFDEDDPPENELSEEGEYQEVYEAGGSEVLAETDPGPGSDFDPGFYSEEDFTETAAETEALPAEEEMPETGVYYEWGDLKETADLPAEEGTAEYGAYSGGEDRSGTEAFPDYESLPGSETCEEAEILPETAGMSEEEELDDPYDKYYKDSWVTKFVPPVAEAQPAPKAGRSKNRALVISLAGIGVIAAVFCGIMVALWDLEKSGEDLTQALKGTYSEKLMQEYLAGMRVADQDTGYSIEFESLTEEVPQAPEASSEEHAQAPEESSGEIPEAPEASEPEPVSEEAASGEGEGDPGTDVEISGLTSIVDAGSGDEIDFAKTQPGGEEAAAVFEVPDPNANYPLEFRTVDYGYFLDALFIGDSRLQGFGMYADLPATYYCVTSFSVYKYDTMKVVQTDQGKKPIFDVLPYDMFTKIYIKVGLNEMGGNDDLFYEKYAELIARLREYEPRAIIYVHAILPVSNAKSASDKYHNNPNIYARNEKLKQFALEQKAYYVDVNSALALEDGSLPPDAASDGIHLKAQYMGPWKESLREQAIVP